MSVDILVPDEKVIKLLKLLIEKNIHNFKFPEYKTYTTEEFYNIPTPLEDIEKHQGVQSFITLSHNQNDSILKMCVKQLNAIDCTNSIVYAPKSVMNWHTNSDKPGYRTYYTFTRGKAIFRYIDPITKKVIDSYDNNGWTARRFKISKDDLLWHTVWSEKLRFSFGFNSYDIES